MRARHFKIQDLEMVILSEIWIFAVISIIFKFDVVKLDLTQK